MQTKPEISDGEGLINIEEDVALDFLSGAINPSTFFVKTEDTSLLHKADPRYVRTYWYLEEITNKSGSVEVISRHEDGMVLRRKDQSSTPMLIYVTAEQDPNILLSRHLLDPGGSEQRLFFDVDGGYSIYARQYCYLIYRALISSS